MPEMTKTLDDALELFVSTLATTDKNIYLDLLAEDAVLEYPYHFPNRPAILSGKQEIAGYFDAFREVLRLDEVRIVATHKTTIPHVVTLQVEGKGQAVQTGLPFEPKYLLVLTFCDGLICHWQHYFNPLTVLTALGGTFSFPQTEA
jgi:ketosteroid isomerase-like protein